MRDDLWNVFLETGSVDDFLRYKDYSISENGDGNN